MTEALLIASINTIDPDTQYDTEDQTINSLKILLNSKNPQLITAIKTKLEQIKNAQKTPKPTKVETPTATENKPAWAK